MKIKITYLFFVSLLLAWFSNHKQIPEPKSHIKLLTGINSYNVGDDIQLQFSGISEASVSLFVSNSYGSTLLEPNLDNDVVVFALPKVLSQKSGLINWKLSHQDQVLEGILNIAPKTTVKSMESYLGPPSIQAGGIDFSMMVVIPTDEYDNPLQDNTIVRFKSQFLSEEEQYDVPTKHLIAYRNIYSPTQKGRILMGSESRGINSKEFDINVNASNPTDFTISTHRNHNYADGNQIVTLKTSQIKDEFGNIVEDGTFVEFYISNKNSALLKTSGSTIDGMATAKIIHPDTAEEWQIKAYVRGMADSNQIAFNFEQLFEDFEVAFSATKRRITVGPLTSFMQQLVPDGFNVDVSVYKDNKLIQTISKQSVAGYADFILNTDIFPSGNYSIKVTTAGIVKTYSSVQL